jgi:hypothetical protein
MAETRVSGEDLPMIITMTAWKRPFYLKDSMAALRIAKQHLEEPLTLIVCIEPSEVQEQMIQLCSGIADREVIISNDKHYGLQANNLHSISLAFRMAKDLKESYVLGLSEDIVLAPDALCLAAWMRDRFQNDEEVLYTSLFSGGGEKRHGHAGNAPLPEEYNRVVLTTWFHCQGWGAWTSTWEDHWFPKWNMENREDSWDSNVNLFVMKGFKQAMPRLSRCTHIGLIGGTHSTPELFELDKPYLFAGHVEIPNQDYWYAQS